MFIEPVCVETTVHKSLIEEYTELFPEGMVKNMQVFNGLMMFKERIILGAEHRGHFTAEENTVLQDIKFTVRYW